MIDLTVAGAGEGTYGKLWNAINSKNPDLQMRLHAVIDLKEREKLHPLMQAVLNETKVRYVRVRYASGKLPFAPNGAGVVMTPNDSHLFYAQMFTALRIPTFVEKPLATRLADIPLLMEIQSSRPRLLYGAEFCSDGKALGLLLAADVLKPEDPRRKYVASPAAVPVAEIFHNLGKLVEIEGQLLEGEGTAGTADHRAWLLDGRHGGMIRDLASHLFGPLYDARLITGKVVGAKVTLGRWEKGMPLGVYRPLRHALKGETYAEIQGKFTVPGGATVPFQFKVGKYWPTNDRVLKLSFERGHAELSYEKPYSFQMEARDRPPVAVTVTTDPYTLALLDFKDFVEGRRDGHMRRALAIVKFNEKMRARGLTSL